MNIAKLVRSGRLEEITETRKDGSVWLIGYQRKASSRKSRQKWTLKEPKLLREADGKLPPSEAAPCPTCGATATIDNGAACCQCGGEREGEATT
jgi:hypothetical protein